MISSRAAGTSAPWNYEMYEMPVQDSEAEDLLGPFPKCDDSHGGIKQWRQEFNNGYSGSPVVAATFKENSRPQRVCPYFFLPPPTTSELVDVKELPVLRTGELGHH